MEVEDIREKAHHICAEYLGGIWTTLKQDDILIEKVHGGFINFMFKLSLPPDIQTISNEPNKVLMKNFSDSLKIGDFGVMMENIIVILLSSKKLSPKVFGVFNGGRLDEFIESRTLNSNDFHDPIILANVVQNLAKMHCIEAPISRDPVQTNKKYENLLQKILSIDRIPEDIKNNPNKAKLFEKYLSLKPKEEYDWLKKMRETSNSPIVLCHNDFHFNNMLLSNTSNEASDDRIRFVDYEMSGYNYRGNDLCRIMNNFCYEVLPDPPYFTINWERYPSEEKQKEIFKIYLHEMQRQNNSNNVVDEEAVNSLIYEVKKFHLMGLFLGLSFSIDNPVKLTQKLDMDSLANKMFDTYLKKKDEFLKSKKK